MGHTDLVEPHIVFKSEIPVRTSPFLVLQNIQDIRKERIAQLEDTNIIERNISEWACPMLMVQKKAFPSVQKPSFSMALDLRLINAII